MGERGKEMKRNGDGLRGLGELTGKSQLSSVIWLRQKRPLEKSFLGDSWVGDHVTDEEFRNSPFSSQYWI